jgi:hypothetical protein
MVNIGIADNIFIVRDIDLKQALTIKEEFESVPSMRNIPYLLYRNILGYYAGWDCINDCSIYCGTRSESTSLKQIKEYAKTL